MEEVQIVIIGGGVVGCAVAAELSAQYKDVFLLEQHPRLGMLTSSRNSGVIHSSIFSEPGSLKAAHCREGKRLTYAFCRQHDIPHRQTGKLILAQTQGEEESLRQLYQRGLANGLEGLQWLAPPEIRAREPHLQARSAIWVSDSGIVDSDRLVRGYATVAQQQGVQLITNARVNGITAAQQRLRLETTRGPLETQVLINSAGLFADEIAQMLGLPTARIYPCRGEYFEVRQAKSYLLKTLAYPVPDATGHGLGVHLTKTLAGTILVGPNARYITDKNDYEKDREPVEAFFERARWMLPELELEDLTMGYSGIRPKLLPPDQHGSADFRIERDALYAHAIHLLGIESPGLTAAPSIARQVARMVQETLA
ncbi:MAG: NAD(P)/FAD-dependent oxidoreductase [Acidobacteria bacterium]|nr:NAD(P)/FAD-dependent oxidoreductase [Acidobacteriota bacterium]